MSQIKLKHSGGNGVIIAAPTSNPAADRTLLLPSDGDSTIDTLARAGNILQVKQTVKKDVFSESVATGNASADITGLSVAITPTSSTNKILLIPSVTCGAYANVLIYKDGSLISDAIGDAGADFRASFSADINIFVVSTITGTFLDTAGGTSEITYSIRLQTRAQDTQTLFVNRANDSDESGGSTNFGRYISTFTAMEVAA
tara:strand:+ start:19 stop:621 length:603 start_codon:yes stop_codon:yes gene_type:complete